MSPVGAAAVVKDCGLIEFPGIEGESGTPKSDRAATWWTEQVQVG